MGEDRVGSGGGFDGVVLAGGTSRRFGGGDKTAAVVGQRSLLGHAVQALADAGAATVVVVGPRLPTDVLLPAGCRLVRTREEPVGSGPGSGLHAGLAHVGAPRVVVLAADLPGIDARAVTQLLAALAGAPGSDGVVPQDAGGRSQWLSAAYRTAALAAAARDAVADRAVAERAVPERAVADRAAADGPGPVRGPGLRDVVGRITWTPTPLPSGWGRLVDVDTPEDLSRARLDDWTRRLVDELDLHAATTGVPAPDLVDLVLDLARDAAHTIARPAAPLTTFALGVAAGLAAREGSADLAALRDRIVSMLPGVPSPDAPADAPADASAGATGGAARAPAAGPAAGDG